MKLHNLSGGHGPRGPRHDRRWNSPEIRPFTGLFAVVVATLVCICESTLHAGYTFKTLASFSYYANGANPTNGQLAFDAAGNIYGTAETGGANGEGALFCYSRETGTLSLLGSFGPPLLGRAPYGGVVFDSAGSIYGTTLDGALLFGTIFKWSAATQSLSDYSDGSPSPGLITQDGIHLCRPERWRADECGDARFHRQIQAFTRFVPDYRGVPG